MQKPWHGITEDEVESTLSTSAKTGLSDEEALERQKRYGPNELEEKKRITVLGLFANQFKSLVVAALFIAAGLSFIMEEYLDVAVIGAVLLVNAAIGTYQEYRAEKSLEALKKMSATSARVLRGGKQEKIFARDLVPGDIILLAVGDRVPGDARLFEAVNLAVDESVLTGESVPSNKFTGVFPEQGVVADRKNMVYKDTIITAGRGRAVVVGTGMETEIGMVAGMLQETRETETPLQKRLSDFMKLLGKGAVVGGLFVLVVGHYVAGFGIEDTLHLVVVQAVSFIPEGLPIVVTVVLAVGVGTMAARNGIVRKLTAVETLGCVTVICTDKTGTLTKNEMTVKQIYSEGRMIDVSGGGYDIFGEFSFGGNSVVPLKDPGLSELMRIAVLCNDSGLEEKDGRIGVIGDPTEGALLVAAKKAEFEIEELKNNYPRTGEVQFDPGKKFMATFNKSDGGLTANAKGAPENVLAMCSHKVSNGKVVKLSEKEREEILGANQEMASRALRVLGFAQKEVKAASESELEGMVFVGLAGMIDPPREEAKKAVHACRTSGIRVVMITGDHKLTAMGIGKEMGILKDDSMVLTGAELDKLSDEEFDKIVDEVRIYARTSSEHKMRVVETLKRKGHVVAMTGDGVNDALAIKKADIGIAMGISGTEVTKESSDMVLADDNFSTIVAAVEEGRGVYLNIQKVVSYLLGTNIGEVLFLLMILLSSFFLPEALPLALLPIHILWVNLVTDGVCDVTLAMEPKERGLMRRKPRRPDERMITADMALFITLSAGVMALGTFLVFLQQYQNGDLAHARTITFTTLVMFQLFNALNVRSRLSLFKIGVLSNRYLAGAILVSILLQLGAIYLPFMNEMMKTTPLSLADWALVLGVSSMLLVVFEAKKLLEKQDTPSMPTLELAKTKG
ncbi:MAG: HAD-IC family P-type ATPase [Candidatus Micrarchaeota archaeon]